MFESIQSRQDLKSITIPVQNFLGKFECKSGNMGKEQQDKIIFLQKTTQDYINTTT
jgi:hypothetical protein